ncbi:MAG: N-(5'-phosphoribosyl)anthranilate isomerase [Rhizobiales bacterium 62-17]|nr:phosphoribosylanthranilate isomerase [Hyphomicrobiales bacterium]OJY00463.1 MAG: N-(5'-phosphoribosyl)anthranilate isomerase [Rhizobiales bacterium 62-17]
MSLLVKICGLSTAPTLEAALDGGADMVGFVFFPKSPRHLSFEQAAALAPLVAGRAGKVALSVDADDALIDGIITALHPDMLQLHGRETPQRVRDLKARTGLPVMKAIPVSTRDDLAAAAAYENVADRLLFDAKPPKDAVLPGGNGMAFDWAILKDVNTRLPWMLSGGLNGENVVAAVEAGAPGLDVSSGVESAPGVKDIGLIRDFIAKARAAARERLANPVSLGSPAKTV